MFLIGFFQNIADTITEELKDATLSFCERFKQVLAPKAPFDVDDEFTTFSKAMLSNLVGGIGFFHGDDIVDRSGDPAYDEENEGFWEETAEARAGAKPVMEGPKDLFTCVPSRPFFPRGFLWDEGFHLMPVMEYDSDLALVMHSAPFIERRLTDILGSRSSRAGSI